MNKAILSIFLLVSIGISTFAQNQNNKVVISDRTGWHKIGETYVDFKKDRDEINVIGADRFASLQFAVTEAPVHVMKLEITYEDGTMKEVPADMILLPDTESKMIDLKGSESNVKKVTFVYHTVGDRRDEKAHVELWGMKTNAEVKK